MPLTQKKTFMHKSHHPQKIGHTWTDLVFEVGGKPRKRFYTDKNGKLEAELYVSGDIKFLKDKPALMKVRWVREPMGHEPMDPTGYGRVILLPGLDDRVEQHIPYNGDAEKGRRLKIQAKLFGDVELTLTGTHYAVFWRR